MSPDEKTPIAEQDVPLTQEMLESQLQRLTESARTAGLSPIQAMFRAYAKRGRGMLAAILASLEDDDSPKKEGE